MNTNPHAKEVLCYGDSNTYGLMPDRSGRFAANIRWTGVLQDQLGEDFYVIEEGLGGRTTDLEHPDPKKPNRNGFAYYKACLESHIPVQLIIIMLGTNDVKTHYNRTANNIANALKQYIDYTRSVFLEYELSMPKILLVSPVPINEAARNFQMSVPTPGVYDDASANTSRQLSAAISRLADETNCLFFDARSVAETGDDGCHLTQASHATLGQALSEVIRDLF